MVPVALRAVLIALALAGAAVAAPREPHAAIAVVAHRDVPARTLDRHRLRSIYLVRETRWSARLPIRAVNLPADSPLRDHFSRVVLGVSPMQLRTYWNDRFFHGVQPPTVLESEEAVLLYVARTPGALGYVSATAATTSDSIRVVLLID